MWLEIYELGTVYFLSTQGLAWQAALKNTNAYLDLLTDTDMFLWKVKDIRCEKCQAIHGYA